MSKTTTDADEVEIEEGHEVIDPLNSTVEHQPMDSLPKKRSYKWTDIKGVSVSKTKVRTTFFGTIRKASDISLLEWIYIAISLTSIIGSLVLTGERIIYLRGLYSCGKYNATTHVHYNQKGPCQDDIKADYTFAILMVWTAICCLYHVIIGVISTKICDIVVFMVSTLIVWAYVLLNFFLNEPKNRTDNKLVRVIMVTLAAPIIIGIGFVLCKRYITSNSLLFGVPQIGASMKLQRSFLFVLIHDSLLKFDIQMGVSVLILWVQESFIEETIDKLELVVITTGLTITIIWFVLAYLATRLENLWLVYSFYATSWLAPFMVILNIVRMISPETVPWGNDLVFHAAKPLIYSAYACGFLALLSRILTIGSMIVVQRNFGKGMKALVFNA